jgi:2-succinyl-6-hydroxy-2,4-cyclohexadiene-1-carboxylate synthase
MSASPVLDFRFVRTQEAPVILYLHGFLGCGEDWDDVTGRLGDMYAHLKVDLPGHGRSEADCLEDNSYRMEGCAEHIVDLLTHLNIETCHIVAYSMGGRLALYLAACCPDRFDRFVIESASPGLKTQRERNERKRHDRQGAESLAMSSGDTEAFDVFLADWYCQPPFQTLDKNTAGFIEMMQRRRNSDPDGLAKSLQLMGTGVQPPLWDKLATIARPVLFIAGARDARFSDLAAEMAYLCPRSEVAIIAGAGHNAHFERPAEYCDQIRRFLRVKK